MHVLQPEDIGEEGVMFIVVAIDDNGLATAAVLHVEKPHIKPDGESTTYCYRLRMASVFEVLRYLLYMDVFPVCK